MASFIPGEHGSQLTLLIRSRSLRLRSGEVLERAAALRARSGGLLKAVDDGLAEAELDDAEALRWYRGQVREMLTAGWSAEELADVGVTDELLRELGLHGME